VGAVCLEAPRAPGASWHFPERQGWERLSPQLPGQNHQCPRPGSCLAPSSGIPPSPSRPGFASLSTIVMSFPHQPAPHNLPTLVRPSFLDLAPRPSPPRALLSPAFPQSPRPSTLLPLPGTLLPQPSHGWAPRPQQPPPFLRPPTLARPSFSLGPGPPTLVHPSLSWTRPPSLSALVRPSFSSNRRAPLPLHTTRAPAPSPAPSHSFNLAHYAPLSLQSSPSPPLGAPPSPSDPALPPLCAPPSPAGPRPHLRPLARGGAARDDKARGRRGTRPRARRCVVRLLWRPAARAGGDDG
jgi:hypothetical protein